MLNLYMLEIKTCKQNAMLTDLNHPRKVHRLKERDTTRLAKCGHLVGLSDMHTGFKGLKIFRIKKNLKVKS